MTNLIFDQDNFGFQKTINSCFIIVLFAAFSGCMTSDTTYVSIESSGAISTPCISSIYLKDGTIIDCKGKIVKFEKGADSLKYAIVRSYTTGKNYKTYWSEKRISQNDILEIRADISKADNEGIDWLALALIILIPVAILCIAFSLSHPFKF